jgi:hypothetical protein
MASKANGTGTVLEGWVLWINGRRGREEGSGGGREGLLWLGLRSVSQQQTETVVMPPGAEAKKNPRKSKIEGSKGSKGTGYSRKVPPPCHLAKQT